MRLTEGHQRPAYRFFTRVPRLSARRFAVPQPWLKRQGAAGKPGRKACPLRPHLEALEDRTLLSTFTVDRLTDTGEGSDLAGDLRYCITQATSGQDSIDFGVTGTINLTGALPDLTSSANIDGPGAERLTVRRDTGGSYRIFTVAQGVTVEISGLTIANGVSSPLGGGGIYNDGTLTVNNCSLSGNSAGYVGGGGICNSPSGTLTINNSALSGNSAASGQYGGGGIYNDGTLTVSNCTLSGNSEILFNGGGISNSPSGILTVSNSTLFGNHANDDGGGAIYNRGALTVDSSTLSRNSAVGGGAIDNSGTLTVSNCTVSSNIAFSSIGGGIINDGTLTVSNTLLSNNIGSSGGGIASDGTLTVRNSTFSGNRADYSGNAIYSFGALMLSNSAISGNGIGAGATGIIYIGSGTATISNCTVSGNSSDDGTIMFGNSFINYNATTATISNSTISGNTIDGGGGLGAGGIFNTGTLTVSNSTISGNTSYSTNGAGGIYNSGTLTVSNSTISGNTGNTYQQFPAAGGIANFAVANSDAVVTLLNSTIANNTGTGNNHTGSELYSGRPSTETGKATVQFRNTLISGDGSRPNFFADTGGTYVSQGHNLSSDNGSGFLTGPGDLINANPLLGPLQDNGGPTPTMALLPSSPALDAGDNTGALDFDQRGPGFARIVGGTIDIGAFEVQPGPATHFQVSAPAQVTANMPFDVTLTALDLYGHTAVGYLGTVTLGSTDTDAGALLPADYTFTTDDQGAHAFVGAIVLITVGDQTLTATDTSDNSITGSATATVDPGPAPPPGGGASKEDRSAIAQMIAATEAVGRTQNVGPDQRVATVDRLFASLRVEESGFIRSRFKTNGTEDGTVLDFSVGMTDRQRAVGINPSSSPSLLLVF